MNLCGLIWLLIQKKSCCIRIGPRNDHICANITTSQGHCLPWTNEIRYLGTYIAKSRQFRCSIDHTKKSFFRSANSIFDKIGRTASEEVTLELLRTKCIPVLIYGLECWGDWGTQHRPAHGIATSSASGSRTMATNRDSGYGRTWGLLSMMKIILFLSLWFGPSFSHPAFSGEPNFVQIGLRHF